MCTKNLDLGWHTLIEGSQKVTTFLQKTHKKKGK
jgi:hypothetical protein